MSRRQPFPSDLESFIVQCIDSVEQIEILLLLREERNRRWTAEELSRQLRSSAHSATLRLQQLERRQLVSRNDDGFAYAAPADVDAMVERLAQAYRERRTAVIEQIFSKRLDAIQSFADAFRIRKEPDEHD